MRVLLGAEAARPLARTEQALDQTYVDRVDLTVAVNVVVAEILFRVAAELRLDDARAPW